jgi:hypothetical protein
MGDVFAPGRARRGESEACEPWAALPSQRDLAAGVSADERRPDRQDAWSDLVSGLLDARDDPMTIRFDEELAAAVESGEVTPQAAHRLRYWQRACLRAFSDHVLTVLPASFGALAEAREDAGRYADQAAQMLADAARSAQAAAGAPDRSPVEPATITLPAEALAARPTAAQPETAAQQADLRLLSDERRASTEQPRRPSTLEAPTPRVLVAELTVLPSALDRTAHDRTS